MTDDEQALLAAALADWDADLPRLVYADWLEEHGQGERAEFIRLQIELAKGHPGPCTAPSVDEEWDDDETTEPDDSVCPTCEHLAALRHRLSRLAVQPGIGMFIDGIPAGWFVGWERGFVESVACTSEQWAEHGQAVCQRHPVREVGLTTMGGFQFVQRNGKIATFVGGKIWPGIRFDLSVALTLDDILLTDRTPDLLDAAYRAGQSAAQPPTD